MIAKFGFLMFGIGFVIAAFTSNLLISSKEKYLAKAYKTERGNTSKVDAEAKHAYVNLLIANGTRLLMAIGFLLILLGYFFN